MSMTTTDIVFDRAYGSIIGRAVVARLEKMCPDVCPCRTYLNSLGLLDGLDADSVDWNAVSISFAEWEVEIFMGEDTRKFPTPSAALRKIYTKFVQHGPDAITDEDRKVVIASLPQQSAPPSGLSDSVKSVLSKFKENGPSSLSDDDIHTLKESDEQ